MGEPDPEPAPARWWPGGRPRRRRRATSPCTSTSTGLEPATTYWYGFRAGDVSSPVGRTRTAPAPDGPVASAAVGADVVRVLVVRVLQRLRQPGRPGPRPRRPRRRLHLRERRRAAGSGGRSGPTGRRAPLVTLADYRARYAQYRTDPDLQALHARHPVAAVWDDHELAGGAWRDGATAHRPRSTAPGTSGGRPPCRPTSSGCRCAGPDRSRCTGRIRLGPLADLVLLDTRLVGRDRPATDARRPVWRVGDRATGRCSATTSGGGWRREVSASTARWLLVGNQVMMAPAPGPQRRPAASA